MIDRELKTKEFKPLLYLVKYKSVIRGYQDTSYPSELEYREFNGPKLVVVSNNSKVPKVMDKQELNRVLKQMIWLDDGEIKLFWKLKPVGNADFVIRDVKVETIYHYGRRLYLKSKFGEKETEANHIGFGYDFFGIHYLNKSKFNEYGIVDYGNLTREKLTRYLSNKVMF